VNYGRYFDLEWSPDGKLLVFAEKTSPSVPYDSFVSTALFAISVETLEKRQLTFPTGGASDHRFALSRDGKTLAFLRHDAGAGVGILLLPLDGGEPRTIHVEPAWTGQLTWTADGQSLIFTSQRLGGNKLFRIAATGGTPELLPVAEDWAFSPAVPRRGHRLVYVREYHDTDLWRVELENPHGPGKPPVPFPSSPRHDFGAELSPDGRWIAFLSDRSGKTELWLSDRDGGAVTPLTDFHAWSTIGPSWSPDGRQLAFYSINGIRDSGGGLFMLDVENRQVRRFAADPTFRYPRWSRDGRWIYASSGRTGQDEIWRFPAAGGAAIQITTRGGVIAEESLTGDYLYFQKTFTDGIWRLPAGGGEETLVLPDFSAPMYGNWRLAADGLYYIDPRTRPFGSVEFFEFATQRRHRIALLTAAATTWSGGMTISPDRKWIVYQQMSRAASEIILVDNFR
jgi:Tol biopolymer transport system component